MNKLYKVVIAGRPNTGKSTLFNLLTGSRQAITDPIPGVTRDFVIAEIEDRGRRVQLLDTGGLFNHAEDDLNQAVHDKTVSALNEADLILFLCDIRELTPSDEETAHLIRKTFASKTMLVLNMADNQGKYDYTVERSEFHRLGLGEPMVISSIHKFGINDLTDFIFKNVPESAVSSGEPEQPKNIDVTIIGKPNAGKSSLLNRLAGTDLALVHDRPGTTRDPIDTIINYHGRRIRFIDTAGIRKKPKVTEDVEYYSVNRAIRSIRESHVTVLLIDAIAGITEQDKKIIALVKDYGKCLVLGINKWDLVDKQAIKFEDYVKRLKSDASQLERVPILSLSALTGFRARNILDFVVRVFDNWMKKIETSVFVKFLQELQQKKALPAGFGMKFGLQVRVGPPVFQVFVNSTRKLPENARVYLLNSICDKFDLEGIFPVLQVKPKKGKQDKN
jgi:GTPase